MGRSGWRRQTICGGRSRRGCEGDLRNIEMPVLCRRDRSDGQLENGSGGLNPSKVVGRKFQDCDLAAGKILLIPEVLVRGDKKIELGLREAQ